MLGYGQEGNIFPYTVQINYSSAHDGNIGKDWLTFDSLHVDHTDDPARYTYLLFLSHQLPNVIPGRFCLPLQQEYCIPRLFTVLIFKGMHPHVGLPIIAPEALNALVSS